jgi:hypothetical protein
MRSQMAPETRRLTTPQASISDSIWAPRAPAVAEVAAVGHDVHLGHGHGHATGHAGHAQQPLRGRCQAEGARAATGAGAGRAAVLQRRPGAHEQGQQHHDEAAGDAHADVGVLPADAVDEVLDDGRPQCAAW